MRRYFYLLFDGNTISGDWQAQPKSTGLSAPRERKETYLVSKETYLVSKETYLVSKEYRPFGSKREGERKR
jgi:hypothetical protein